MSGESVCLVLFKENCRRWDQTIHDKHAKYRDTRVIPIFRFCLERRSIECITFGSRLYHLFMTPNPFCWKKLWIKGEPFSRICCTSTYIQYFSELCYCIGSIMVISISVCILWTTWIPSYIQNTLSKDAVEGRVTAFWTWACDDITPDPKPCYSWRLGIKGMCTRSSCEYTIWEEPYLSLILLVPPRRNFLEDTSFWGGTPSSCWWSPTRNR